MILIVKLRFYKDFYLFHIFSNFRQQKSNRDKIVFLLSKSYFEGLSRVSFSFPVDLEWSRTAKVAIFNDFNDFVILKKIKGPPKGPWKSEKVRKMSKTKMAMSILRWAPGGPLGGPLIFFGKNDQKTIKITKNSYFGGPEVF